MSESSLALHYNFLQATNLHCYISEDLSDIANMLEYKYIFNLLR